jgi:uncharacterized protein with HEPN domain
MANEDLYLKNILESIAKIERYVSDFDETSFRIDDITQDAVIRQLEIIGEAPDSCRTKSKSLIRKCPGERFRE